MGTPSETERDWTELHRCAEGGDPEAVERLLCEGADPNAREPDCGMTPLHVAASEGRVEAVKALIAGGADLDARDDTGQTPLQWAAGDYPEAAEVLLANGAELDIFSASALGKAEAVLAILEREPDAVRAMCSGRTALHVAALSGHGEVVEALLARGADVNARASSGWTPTHFAAESRHRDVEALLRSHGGKVRVWVPPLLDRLLSRVFLPK